MKSVDNGQTDDRACLYNKLTHVPKGSGELIKRREKKVHHNFVISTFI